MAAESVQLSAWLYSLLNADGGLATALGNLAAEVYYPAAAPSVIWNEQWYPDAAPQGAPNCFGLWRFAFSPDVWGMGGERVIVQPRLYAYVVAASAAFDDLAPTADRLDELLHQAAGATTAINVMSVLRISEYSRQEDLQGVRWLSLGGIYQVQARSI